MVTAERHATPGYLPGSFIDNNEGLWVPSEGRLVAIGCGDDRAVTAESAELIDAHMVPGTLPLEIGFASIYGGRKGIEQNLLVAGVAAHGEDFFDKINGFAGAEREVKETVGTLGLLHSAETNESQRHEFNEKGCGAVGCAYCELLGATAYYLDADPAKSDDDLAVIEHIVRVARNDQEYVFGNDNQFEYLLEGKQVVARRLGGLAASGGQSADACHYKVSRPEFRAAQQAGTLISILAGQHADPRETGLVINLDHRSVGSANQAAAAGNQVYRSDITRVTAAFGSVLQEYAIPPELFARAVLLDSAPVRAALVASSPDPDLRGKLDPVPLAIGVRGDIKEALDYLKQWQ